MKPVQAKPDGAAKAGPKSPAPVAVPPQGGAPSATPKQAPSTKQGPAAKPASSPKQGSSPVQAVSSKAAAAGAKPGGGGPPKKGGQTPAPAAATPKGSAPAPATVPAKGLGSKPSLTTGSGSSAKGASGKSAKRAAPDSPPMAAIPRKFPKGGPGKAELRKYRAHLLELRRALLASSKDLASEALKSSASEFTPDRAVDSGSENYEQDFSLQLLEGEAAQLADIREALLKIDGKVELPYGICEACSDTDKHLCESCPWIPTSRLEVMPHARLCVQTKEIEERKKQR